MGKKFIFIGGIIVFIIIGCILFLFDNKKVERDYNKENKEITKNYIVYVKASALLRLDIEENYTKCEDDKCLRSLLVTYVELIDDKAKSIFKNEDLLEDNSFSEVFENVVDIITDHNDKIDSFTIYSDFEDIKSDIKLYENYEIEVIIDTKENLMLLHEGKMISEDETTTTTVDKNGSKKFSLGADDVTFKNKKKGYSYSVDKDTRISVTAKGLNSKLEKIKKIKLYVDVDDLEIGKKKVRLHVDDGDDDITYTISPSSLSVEVIDTSELPTEEVTTTTPVSDDNKVGINLNDSVEYYEMSACYKLVYIEPSCVTSTIGELKIKYPDYNQELDSSLFNDEDKFNDNVSAMITYFPACKLEIPSNIKTALSGVAGFAPTINTTSIDPYWIKFKDSTYDKYIQNIDFTKYSIYPDESCSKEAEKNYKVLDEDVCKKYNLTCDRW